MAIQKRHRGTLGDFDGLEAPDLSFNEPETPKEAQAQPVVAQEEVPVTAVPAPQEEAKPAVEAAVAPAAEEVSEEKPRRGRPRGIKGAGPKRLNLIQGDKDKVLALQLPSKLIDGLRRYADDHDITMKELIGKTLMKKIGPEYYK